jgi:hypothetical protein
MSAAKKLQSKLFGASSQPSGGSSGQLSLRDSRPKLTFLIGSGENGESTPAPASGTATPVPGEGPLKINIPPPSVPTGEKREKEK